MEPNPSQFVQALRVRGTSQRIANLCGVSRQAVTNWNGVVPYKHVELISRELGIPAAELRPDIARTFGLGGASPR